MTTDELIEELQAYSDIGYGGKQVVSYDSILCRNVTVTEASPSSDGDVMRIIKEFEE